jgi:RNA polymerase sigma factor (sigma-70 family)
MPGKRPHARPDLRRDPLAFEAFYRAHAEALLAYFVRRVIDPHLALGLAAETFAKAYRQRRRYRGTTPEEAAGWLFAIARNEHLQWVRRGRVEQRALHRLGLSVPTFTEDDIARVNDLVDLEDARREVRDAVAGLPAAQRTAVWLRVVDELPYSEVAERLGVTEQTARARVSRGLGALRRDLSPLSAGATS